MIKLILILALISNLALANENYKNCSESCLKGYRASLTKYVMENTEKSSPWIRKLLTLQVNTCNNSCKRFYVKNNCNN